MILIMDNGNQIRGDLIHQATLRSSLLPIPLTLEVSLRVDDSIRAQLKQGKMLTLGSGEQMQIIDSRFARNQVAQDEKQQSVMALTAILDAVAPMAFVRRTAILAENTSLVAAYRAAGCRLRSVDGDIQAANFSVFAGQACTVGVAHVLQEEAACVMWRAGKLVFARLDDLPARDPIINLQGTGSEDSQNGFQQRHEVPWFWSTGPDGLPIYGNRDKERSSIWVPKKNLRQLRNMSKCLIHRKEHKVYFNAKICAGDTVAYAGRKKPLIVITAAHVFQGGADGSANNNQFTKLWLGSLESGS